jgi:hypothetical protein
MRKMQLYSYEKEKDFPYALVPTLTEEWGYFHEWGIDTNEFGEGTFSTAIVEMPDGTIRNLHTELVKFMEPNPSSPPKSELAP